MDTAPNMLALIRRKRAGLELSAAQIEALVRDVMAGLVPDYQLAALLMAACFQGLGTEETLALTRAFVASGSVISWEGWPAPLVDKHSTGGVGDKVSLALLPWLAAAGVNVPKMSGRGLGFTGGTLDKLESIPGFRTDLSLDEFRGVLSRAGCALTGQSAELAPADKVFYALRDATDTVEEPGLIAASVMSKKIAAGAGSIVLDIKCGRGAFFKEEEGAEEFARLAERIGGSAGRRVAGVITAMSQPLGRAVGNALEVQEAVRFLALELELPDFEEVCLALGAAALLLSGLASSREEARDTLRSLRRSGAALERFQRWVREQGGDLQEFQHRLAGLEAYRRITVLACREGYVSRLDARIIGELARTLGAGRTQLGQAIDLFVGIESRRKLGDHVQADEELAWLYVRPQDPRGDQELCAAFQAALTLAEAPADPGPAVIREVASPQVS